MSELMTTYATENAARPSWSAAGWLRADWAAVAIEVILIAVGVVFIYGAGVEVGGDMASKWHRQLLWTGLGACLYVTAASVDYHKWARLSWLGYLLAVALLLGVLVFGKTLNNTRGWLKVPGIGFLQPAELAKPLTLLLLSWLGTRPALRHSSLGEWLPVLALGAVSALPILLVCLQPDAGTAMVFIPVTATLVFLTGLRWRWFFLAGLLVLLAVPVVFTRLKPYQKDRVKVFLDAPARSLAASASAVLPERTGKAFTEGVEAFLAPAEGTRKRDDWNAVQSLLAVGSGGLTGKGYLHGTQHVLGYLPKTIAPTDFIFSVIAEETGFLGGATLLALMAALMLCFFKTALDAPDRLGTFIATGSAIMLTTHIIINISMTIRAAPIVGLPLPFVSYGGSFMLGTMLLAGLVQSVHIHRRTPAAQEPAPQEEPDSE